MVHKYVFLAAFSACMFLGGGLRAQGYSIRLFGNGVNAPDLDRVKIRIDDPATVAPGPPVDVGATDFTIEWWMRGFLSENGSPAVSCGSNINWIYGNIIIDRDRYNQDRKYGISIAGGQVVFGVSGDQTGDLTICGTSMVLDSSWHHIAVQRRISDGFMYLYVDGVLESSGDGPDGDISYPDDGIPGNFCGGPCDNSDPFIVLGAEKHDAGASYPSYSGWMDELRFSTSLRYNANFNPSDCPFTTDAQTAGLYHFDAGSGTVLTDVSGAVGGPSDGALRIGGNPSGPLWDTLSPMCPTTNLEDILPSDLEIWPNPLAGNAFSISLPPSLSTPSVEIFDLAGRKIPPVHLSFSPSSPVLHIELPTDLAAGWYAGRLRTNGKSHRFKFFKMP